MEPIFTLLLALIFDLTMGEPPDRWHPVAWLGKLISLEIKITGIKKGKGKILQFITGLLLVVFTLAIICLACCLLLKLFSTINIYLYIIVSALLLKFSFSLRGLIKAANSIRILLEQNNTGGARGHLKALVSRNTVSLNETQIVSATVESLAENSCDSFVAPIFYFLIFGIPGALGYRIANTFDTMIGYHGEWEYAGKFAARLDDVLNFIPARISALLLVIAAWISKKNTSKSWNIIKRDHGKTESPNAGWTMSAIAGALEVKLEKIGCYQLGDDNRSLSVNTISSSVRLVSILAILWSFIVISIQGVTLAAI